MKSSGFFEKSKPGGYWDDSFELEKAASVESKPAEFESKDGKQKVMFSGLDCLPGQLDLFEVDGGVK